jgi:hypothetical protein
MMERIEQEKTLQDCAGCDFLRICDAHTCEGSWKHRAGKYPCKVVL